MYLVFVRGLWHNAPKTWDFQWEAPFVIPRELLLSPSEFKLIRWFRVGPPVAFPGSPSGREPACKCRRRKKIGFDPWVRKIPWRRKWQPVLVFLPGESHGQRNLVDYSPWGRKESGTTEWLTHTHMPLTVGRLWTITCGQINLSGSLGSHQRSLWTETLLSHPGYLLTGALS